MRSRRFVDAQIDALAAHATNEVNDEHVITATVQRTTASSRVAMASMVGRPVGTTVDFSLLLNVADATFSDGDDDCVTGAAGECSVTITTTDAGDVDIHATTTFPVGGISLTRATGTGGNNSADANKVFVDAFITINPDATNNVGEPHTFTVVVQQDAGDGNGPVDVPDGTIVTVTLTPAGGAQVLGLTDECGTTGTVDGECDVTFHSDTAGTVTGHAAVSLTIGGVTVERNTDGVAPNSDDAVKTYITGALQS